MFNEICLSIRNIEFYKAFKLLINTLIHYDYLVGNTELIISTAYSDINILKKLILDGANVNEKNIFRTTPLIMAINWGNVEAVKLLLDNSAVVNCIDYNGKTALIYAAKCGHSKIAEILVDNGAMINYQDYNKRTALDYSIDNNNFSITNYLIQHGATEHNEGARGIDEKIDFFLANLLINIINFFSVLLDKNTHNHETNIISHESENESFNSLNIYSNPSLMCETISLSGNFDNNPIQNINDYCQYCVAGDCKDSDPI